MKLGQVSEVARRLDLLHGERLTPAKADRVRRLCYEMKEVVWDGDAPWRLVDDATSNYTLTAFLSEAQLTGNERGEACGAAARVRRARREVVT